MKTDTWNGHEIRFVWHEGEWWAVAVDVCAALGLKQVTRALHGLPVDWVTISKGIHDALGREREANIVNELAVYRLVFKSRKPEAKDFQEWVYGILKTLRQQTGLEGFQVFRMLDKEHQKQAMAELHKGLQQPVRVDFIKANTIANKAVSNRHGYDKMVKKNSMTPAMLIDRQPILDDTIELMTVNDKYRLGLSISESIYQKHCD